MKLDTKQRIETQIEKLRSLGNVISESSKAELMTLLRDLLNASSQQEALHSE